MTRLTRISRRPVRVLLSLLASLAVLLGTAVLATPASASTEPALNTPVATLDAALHCPSSFTHPNHEPVLLVHGFTSNYAETWGWGFTPALTNAGYDVCGIDLPGRAMGDIQVSTEYVVNAIDTIYAETGHKVDVIGHSEGNLEMHWAVEYWPHLQSEIDDMVDIASPTNGIVGGSLDCVFPCSAAASQFSLGSNFLAAMNSQDITPGNISYTNIYSATDEAIVPYTTAPMTGATNILIQDVCPGRVVAHFSFLGDSLTYLLVLDALSHAGPANPNRLPFGKCLGVYLPGVNAASATAATAIVAANFDATLLSAPTVTSEPPLAAYALG